MNPMAVLRDAVIFAGVFGFFLGGFAYWLVSAVLLWHIGGPATIITSLILGIPVWFALYKFVRMKSRMDKIPLKV